jgi:hypothetical protein
VGEGSLSEGAAAAAAVVGVGVATLAGALGAGAGSADESANAAESGANETKAATPSAIAEAWERLLVTTTSCNGWGRHGDPFMVGKRASWRTVPACAKEGVALHASRFNESAE